MSANFLSTIIASKFHSDLHAVVPDSSLANFTRLDLSSTNPAFTKTQFETTETLTNYLAAAYKKAGTKYLIGGYAENRMMYLRSNLFDQDLAQSSFTAEEPRSLHLGIDIWGKAGTPVSAPIGGMIHSFHDNANFGDYGPTIILQHQIDSFNFYTLYGHLSRRDLSGKRVGQVITRGEAFSHFGEEAENGNWPPHLHFQIITDMGNWEGDFPGVCKPGEAEKWLGNCPDPKLLLNIDPYMLPVV